MSGFIVLRLNRCLPLVRQVDVNGFKFFYELLAISRGRLQVGEIPLSFQPRLHGSSKLDLAILWDFVVSLIRTATLRLLRGGPSASGWWAPQAWWCSCWPQRC